MAKYGVFLRKSIPDRMVVVKTTIASPTDSDWDSQDGEVDFKGDNVLSLWAFENNDDIYIATQQESGRVAFHLYDPGTDTWTIRDETVAVAGDTDFDAAPANPAVSMAVRSDGDIVIVAAYNDGTNERLRVFVSPITPSEGELWTWGRAGDGALGNGTTSPNISSPVQVGALVNWDKVAAGTHWSLAVKTDGTLWAWGDNNPDGQLGDGTTISKSSPVQIGSLTDWADADAGVAHALAVKTGGALWAWGRNTEGRLGDGTIISKSSPVQIGALTNWATARAGSTFSVARKTDNTAWAWGSASSGKLGNGTTTPNLSSPIQIGALTDWAEVTAGDFHALAVKTNGTLWAWGDNAPSGKLGDGTTISKSSPVQIGSLTDWADVRCGNQYSLAIKTDGTVWAWGAAGNGQLGDNTTVNKSSPVQIGSGIDWTDIAAGNSHTIAVKLATWINAAEASGGVASTDYAGVVVVGPDGSDRISWAYGDITNDDVDLRSISSADAIAAVTEIDGAADVATLLVAPGVIDGSNKIYLPYVDADGQISIASWTSGAAPGISLDTTLTARDVFGQERTTPAYAAACLALDGTSDAHLVYYDDVDRDIYHEDDVDGATGSDTLIEDLIDTSSDTLWAWGESDNGRLGNGTTTPDLSSPVQIGALTDWANVSVGKAPGGHSLAVKTDGTLWAWGLASSGRLGDGTTISKSSPVQIGALTDWANVFAGDNHSLALKTDGTLWAWGESANGRLGNGTTTPDLSSPVQIGALTDWANVSAGVGHSLTVKTDGTLWVWGLASNGQLGDGTTISKSSPVQIGALTDWANVSAGSSHSLAVKTDGTLWAWGRASNGRLGNGTIIPNLSSPVQIGALTNWASVLGGSHHSLALKTDGTLWVWGFASSGRLGDGTTVDKSSPVQIGTLTDWANASAGSAHSLAIKADRNFRISANVIT